MQQALALGQGLLWLHLSLPWDIWHRDPSPMPVAALRSLLVHSSKAQCPSACSPLAGVCKQSTQQAQHQALAKQGYGVHLRAAAEPGHGGCREPSRGPPCRWAGFKPPVQTVIRKRGDQQQPSSRHGAVCVQSWGSPGEASTQLCLLCASCREAARGAAQTRVQGWCLSSVEMSSGAFVFGTRGKVRTSSAELG